MELNFCFGGRFHLFSYNDGCSGNSHIKIYISNPLMTASRPEVFGQAASAKFSSGEPRRSRALR